MYNNTRTFCYYQLSFTATGGKEFPKLDPHPVLKHIEWLIGAFNEKIVYSSSKGKKNYYIQAIEDTKDSLLLLMRFVDGQLRDHTLEDIKTRATQCINKTPTQGEAFTSHIYISKIIVDGKLKMIVENVHGFTLGNLSIIFNGILRQYLKKHRIFIKVKHPTGKFHNNQEVFIDKWPAIEARGTLSDTFESEIDSASIDEIEFISTSETILNLDGIAGFNERRHAVKIVIAPAALTTRFLDSLRHIAKKNSGKYQEIAIRYKHDGTKPVTARLSCDASLSAINADKLVKKVMIDKWPATVQNAYDQIQHEVRKAIEDHKNE